MTELDALRPHLVPGAEDAVAEGLVAMGAVAGSRGVRALYDGLLARYGRESAFEDKAARDRARVSLSYGRPAGTGMLAYTMTLDAEGAAILEAAIGPLSAPAPVTDDHGDVIERDRRTPEQRRGQALLAVVARAVEAADRGVPAARATLVVTCDADTLAHRTTRAQRARDEVVEGLRSGMPFARPSRVTRPFPVDSPGEPTREAQPGVDAAATTAATPPPPQPPTPIHGTVVGTPAGELILPPSTLRRLACDAGVLPMILGGPSGVLDLGRERRTAAPTLVTALWARDEHCTYPGCTMPATWCEAHHLVHWADGGPTSLDNLALLCTTHHHQSHRDDTTASWDPGGHLVWDLTPGSYGRLLSSRHRRGTPDAA